MHFPGSASLGSSLGARAKHLNPQVAPSETKYADFLVNTQNHSFRRSGSEGASSRSKLMPNSVFGIFDIVDTNGWKSDRVWVRNGIVHDWNQYKLLADTSVGRLVLHQRFQPGNPGGNPWDNFLLAPSIGETGVAVDSLPGHLVCEKVHLIYLFESGGLLTASYGSKGKLIGLPARHDANASFRYSDLHADSPFDMYELPEDVNDSAMEPPLNDVLRKGIGKITSSTTYPALDELISIFVVEQYDIGRLFTVRIFNAHGKIVTSTIMQFNTRPYDRAILAASQSAG